MDKKELKKELGLSNKDLAECFNMSYGAYANSTAKERYEKALKKATEIAAEKKKAADDEQDKIQELSDRV